MHTTLALVAAASLGLVQEPVDRAGWHDSAAWAEVATPIEGGRGAELFVTSFEAADFLFADGVLVFDEPFSDHFHVATSPLEVVEVALDASDPKHGTAPRPYTKYELVGERLVFTVREAAQGIDLSGDGDTKDKVLHSYDVQTGEVVNAGAHVFGLQAGELGVLFHVGEKQQGEVDLNGDGDAIDTIMYHWSYEAPAATSLGMPSAWFPDPLDSYRIDGTNIALFSSELWDVDQNGDGDALDDVLFTGSTAVDVENTGLAGVCTILGCSPHELLFLGDWLYFRVSEATQGDVDLNGDGDAEDVVSHVRNMASGATLPIAFELDLPQGVEDRLAAFVFEAEFGQDFTGDGDLADRVVYVADFETGEQHLVPLASAGFTLTEDGVYVNVSEAEQGAEDLNGDGDAEDYPVFSFAFDSGELDLVEGLGDGLFPIYGPSHVVFRLSEVDADTDLNGDGDRADVVVQGYELASRTVFNLGVATDFDSFSQSHVALWGHRALIRVSELHQGDVNGNGVIAGDSLHSADLRTGEVVNLGFHSAVDSTIVQVAGDTVVVKVPESTIDVDGNGDGDLQDDVLVFALL